MANIKIIDLPTGSPESTSFVEATQVDELAESGRSTVKLALNSLGNFVAGQGASPLEYGNLETESTTLIGAANELHNSIGAEAYDSTSTYNTDDYCIYNGELYKCNYDNVTGAWDATKWDLTKVIDELGGGNADYIECTQAQYDAWEQGGTLEADKMYFITDGKAAGSYDYSYTERIVGTWVDGSSIYQKTIYIPSMPDGSSTTTEYLFLNSLVDMVIDYSAILFTHDHDQFLPLPYIFTALATANIQFGFKNKSDNKFYLDIRSGGIDRSSQSAYVTVRYTKV